MPSSDTPQNLDLFQASVDEPNSPVKKEVSSSAKDHNKPASNKNTAISTCDHAANGSVDRFLNVVEVAQRYGLSKSSVWRLAAENKDFPKPFKLAKGTTRWRLSDLIAFERLRNEVRERNGK